MAATPTASALAVRVRPVTRADTEEVLALRRVVFPEYGDSSKPHARLPRGGAELAFGDGLFWLAEREGRVVR